MSKEDEIMLSNEFLSSSELTDWTHGGNWEIPPGVSVELIRFVLIEEPEYLAFPSQKN